MHLNVRKTIYIDSTCPPSRTWRYLIWRYNDHVDMLCCVMGIMTLVSTNLLMISIFIWVIWLYWSKNVDELAIITEQFLTETQANEDHCSRVCPCVSWSPVPKLGVAEKAFGNGLQLFHQKTWVMIFNDLEKYLWDRYDLNRKCH